MSDKEGLDPKQRMSKARAAFTGAYTGSTLEPLWVSDPSWTTSLHPNPC